MTPEGGRKRSPAVQSNAAVWACRRDQAHSLASHLLLVRTPSSDSPRSADPPPPAAGRRGSPYPVGPRHRPSELCGPFVFTTFSRGPASSVSLGNCLLAGSASKLDVASFLGTPRMQRAGGSFGSARRCSCADTRELGGCRTQGYGRGGRAALFPILGLRGGAAGAVFAFLHPSLRESWKKWASRALYSSFY